VAYGLRQRKVAKSEIATKVAEALEMVKMTKMADRKPRQLSGGQQQRVALARAIVNRPEVLLLDEPLGALDLKLRRQMQVELKRIQTEVGLTFIHVTHDQEEAMTMADTVAVMNHGRIEQMGPPAEMYDLPRTSFVANFVGQSNLGSGRVVDRDGTHLVAEIQGTKVKIPLARTAIQDGDITFGVRPEKVRVMRTPSEGVGDDVKGIVLDVSFTGVATQYLVQLPSGTLWSCYEQNLDVEPIDLRPGDEVWLSWNPHHAFGVPVDEAEARAAAEAGLR
jgi:spermidine/putrescine transport system ATP-binding protein